MTTDVTWQPVPAGPTSAGVLSETTEGNWAARTAIANQVARRSLRSGAVWGVIFGLFITAQALAYAATYKTAAERRQLASSFSSGGLNALMGRAHQLQTVGGYTTWKSLGSLSVIGAIWALLLSTKLLRGEEDAGRWELLLAGQTTRRRAAAQAMVGLLVGAIALVGITALIAVWLGRDLTVHFTVGAGIFLALSVTSGAVLFLSVGALTSQLAANRHQAAAYGAGLLGLFFALRMVADSVGSAGWLLSVSPLGWIEKLQPLTDPDPLPLLWIFGLAAAMVWAAVYLAGRRDLGASTLPDRSTSDARTRLLSGPIGLTVRLIRPNVIGWFIGIGAAGLLVGSVAKAGAKSLEASKSVQAALRRLEGGGGEIKAYLGVSLLVVSILVVLMAANQVTAARREEAAGRAEHLLVRPVSRSRWFLGRLAVAALVVVFGGVFAGLCAWFGVAGQHAGIGWTTLLEAGCNMVPTALCVLGLGALVFGVAPRLTAIAVYGIIAWSFLVELLAGLVNANHWLLDTSIFFQMNPAPAVAPDWTSGLVMVAVGALGVAIGAVAFARRDLVPE
jgi:ABC-2 type transport system permease protein